MSAAAAIQPRMLDARDAAIYCGVSVARLRASVVAVEMPGHRLRYDRHDLDQWLDSIKKPAAHDIDALIGELGT